MSPAPRSGRSAPLEITKGEAEERWFVFLPTPYEGSGCLGIKLGPGPLDEATDVDVCRYTG